MLMLAANDSHLTEGWLFIYSCRQAFVPHVESAVAAVVAGHHTWQWWEQSARPGAGTDAARPHAGDSGATAGAKRVVVELPVRRPAESQPPCVRAELRWRGDSSTASTLASALRAFPGVHAEVVAVAAPGTDGRRHLLVPELGLWSAPMDSAGETLITEQHLRSTLAGADPQDWPERIDRVLGGPWERILTPLREAPKQHCASLLRVV